MQMNRKTVKREYKLKGIKDVDHKCMSIWYAFPKSEQLEYEEAAMNLTSS